MCCGSGQSSLAQESQGRLQASGQKYSSSSMHICAVGLHRVACLLALLIWIAYLEGLLGLGCNRAAQGCSLQGAIVVTRLPPAVVDLFRNYEQLTKTS